MENNESFKMTYSAQQQEEIASIRKKYLPQERSQLQQLRDLDAGATRKATTLSVTVGIIGSLIMGIGMSLTMSDFGSLLGQYAMPVGIATGILGIGILACAYPLYTRKLKKERAKIAPEILRLSEIITK